MVLRNAKDALLDSTDESRLKGLAPPTPPQLSPVKPRRACAAHPVAPSLPDVAALTAELHRLVNGDGECSPGDRPEGRGSAAWESLPLDLWDVVWHDHLDLPARMAFCLTNTTFWGRYHGQTVRLLCASDLRVANASFAVDVRQGVLLHPNSTVFLRAAPPANGQAWYQLLDAFLRRLPSGRGHCSLARSPAADIHCTTEAIMAGHAASSQPCVELRCQLPSTFSTAPAGQAPYDMRHGFCYGHLPANYGGVKLCLLISGSERDAQFWFEDVRLRLKHMPEAEHGACATHSSSDDTAEQRQTSAKADSPDSGEDDRYVLEMMSMWPCRRGNAGVEAVPQEGATYAHAPWLNGS